MHFKGDGIPRQHETCKCLSHGISWLKAHPARLKQSRLVEIIVSALLL